MIIPTPEYNPLFAEDGVPFRLKMMRYIEREFGDLPCIPREFLQTDGESQTHAPPCGPARAGAREKAA